MARVIDITDKLTFDGNPRLKIREQELEVNADAPTILKIMNFFGANGSVGVEQVNEAYRLIFPEESRAAIEEMKLSVSDWMAVVQEAVSLVTDTGDTRGK